MRGARRCNASKAARYAKLLSDDGLASANAAQRAGRRGTESLWQQWRIVGGSRMCRLFLIIRFDGDSEWSRNSRIAGAGPARGQPCMPSFTSNMRPVFARVAAVGPLMPLVIVWYGRSAPCDTSLYCICTSFATYKVSFARGLAPSCRYGLAAA
jgi:hypothetical protein